MSQVREPQTAQVLTESEMEERFERLISRLAKKRTVDEISDIEIQAEVDAIRRARAQPC